MREPSYKFGHGLLYTTFDTSKADVSPHPNYENIEQVPFVNFIINTGCTLSLSSQSRLTTAFSIVAH